MVQSNASEVCLEFVRLGAVCQEVDGTATCRAGGGVGPLSVSVMGQVHGPNHPHPSAYRTTTQPSPASVLGARGRGRWQHWRLLGRLGHDAHVCGAVQLGQLLDRSLLGLDGAYALDAALLWHIPGRAGAGRGEARSKANAAASLAWQALHCFQPSPLHPTLRRHKGSHHLLCCGLGAALKERPKGEVPSRLLPVGEVPSRAAPAAAPAPAAPAAGGGGGRQGGRLPPPPGRWVLEGEVPYVRGAAAAAAACCSSWIDRNELLCAAGGLAPAQAR